MKEQDKEPLLLYMHKYFSVFCLVFEEKVCCTFGVIQTLVQALVRSEHSWVYLGFSQNLAPRLPDSDVFTPLCDSFLQQDYFCTCFSSDITSLLLTKKVVSF